MDKEFKTPEKRMMPPEEGQRYNWDKDRVIEKREIPKFDKIVSEEIRREIDILEANEDTKKEAEKKAQKIEFLGEKEKIEHLLQLAKEKGVIFAIQVAKKMNEPYLLDVLHDTLAREGFFKDFSL